MPTKDNKGKTIGSVNRSLEIIDILSKHGASRVTELSKYLGYSTSSIHDHLNTLKSQRYVVQDGDLYRLGLKFLSLGERSRAQYCIDDIEYPVRKLSEETGDIVSCVVEEFGRGIIICRESGEQNLNTAEVGKQINLHSTAAGKVILAYLPEQRVDDIIGNGLTQETEHTITDQEVLKSKLSQIQEREYAVNQGERIDRLYSVAVPIRGLNDWSVGALALTSPKHRMNDDRLHNEIPELLSAISNEVELNITY